MKNITELKELIYPGGNQSDKISIPLNNTNRNLKPG